MQFFFAFLAPGTDMSIISDTLKDCRTQLDKFMASPCKGFWSCFAVKAENLDDAEKQAQAVANGDQTIETWRCDIIRRD